MTTTPPRRRAPGMSPEQRRETIVHAALPLVAEFGAAVTTAQVARAAGIGEATIFRVFADKDALLEACVAEALDPTDLLREFGSIPFEQPLPARLVDAADALRAHLDRMGTVIGALHASGHGRRSPLSVASPGGVASPGNVGSPGDLASPGKFAASGGRAASGTAADPGGGVAPGAAAASGNPAASGREGEPSGGRASGRDAAPGGAPGEGATPGRSSGRDAAQAAIREALGELFEPDRAALRLPVDTLAEAFLGLLFGHGRVPGDGRPRLGTHELVDLFLHGAFAAPAQAEPASTSGETV